MSFYLRAKRVRKNSPSPLASTYFPKGKRNMDMFFKTPSVIFDFIKGWVVKIIVVILLDYSTTSKDLSFERGLQLRITTVSPSFLVLPGLCALYFFVFVMYFLYFGCLT